MSDFATIVVGVHRDRSDAPLLDAAAELSRRRIHLVGVARATALGRLAEPSVSLAMLAAQTRRRVETAWAPKGSIPVLVTRDLGEPVHPGALSDIARTLKANLILVRAKRAADVFPAAPCPVLVVDSDRKWRSPARILIGIDPLTTSNRVVVAALSLAGPTTEIVAVSTRGEEIWPWGEGSSVPPHDTPTEVTLDQIQRTTVRNLLGTLHATDRVQVKIVRYMPPAAGIVQVAQETTADLVVVGTRGHGALKRLFVGSTSAAVIARSPCPVLVVPPETRLASRLPARMTHRPNPRM